MDAIYPSMQGAGVEAAAMIEAVLPGVVQVRRGTHRRGPRGGAGAGFIWSSDGSVMTNHHVVAGSGGKVEVVLTDDRSFDAEMVGSSRRLDLASRAGLLVGDVLLGVAGEPVEDAASLRGALSKVGDFVHLRMMRGGEVREIEAGFADSGRTRARGA